MAAAPRRATTRGWTGSTRSAWAPNTPINTGNASEGLLALKDGKWVVLRVPYPLGYYTKWMDGRIDDPNGGWKGRGLWSTISTRAPFHMEGGKGTRARSCASSCVPIRWPNEPGRERPGRSRRASPATCWTASPPTPCPCRLPARARDAPCGDLFAHLHDVRLMWLASQSPGPAGRALEDRLGQRLDHDALRTALDASAAAISTMVEAAVDGDGRVKGFKPHVTAFVGYLRRTRRTIAARSRSPARSPASRSTRRSPTACGSGGRGKEQEPGPQELRNTQDPGYSLVLVPGSPALDAAILCPVFHAPGVAWFLWSASGHRQARGWRSFSTRFGVEDAGRDAAVGERLIPVDATAGGLQGIQERRHRAPCPRRRGAGSTRRRARRVHPRPTETPPGRLPLCAARLSRITRWCAAVRPG